MKVVIVPVIYVRSEAIKNIVATLQQNVLGKERIDNQIKEKKESLCR